MKSQSEPVQAAAKKHSFSADRAIEEIAQDRLGRSFFASQLADTVCNWKEKDSLVLALYGAWGSGKTSVKNLFKCHCKAKGDPHIVEFNPWQWSAQEKIFEAFFRAVAERLEQRDIAKESKHLAKKWKYFAAGWGIWLEAGKHVYRSASTLLLISGVSALVAKVPNPVTEAISSTVGVAAAAAGGVGLVLPGLFEKFATLFEARAAYAEKDIEERRKELIKELRKLRKPLVIIIDDFDRLTRDEVKIMIQLVKANTDLPNVVYLLLFQEESIATALDDNRQKGRDYLEKIIQVGFDIPEAQQSRLQKILLEELTETFSSLEFGLRWDKDRWDYIYNDYLKHYFRTLRDVYRFVSMLKFHVALHRNKDVLEVNPVDLITLHTLRVFEHPVFERIRDSAVSDSSRFLEAMFFTEQEQQERHQIVLSEIVQEPDEKAKKRLEGIITALFPQASPHFRGDEPNWDRDLRICHQNHFAKYFEFALREDSISALEIATLIRSAGDPQEVAATLDRYIKANRITDFLDRLEPYAENMPTETIGSLLSGFLRVTDNLPRVRPALFSPAPVVQCTRLLRNLLSRVLQPSRAEIISKAIEGSDAFTLPAFIVSADEKNPNEPAPDRQPILSEDDLKKLRPLVVEKIKKAAHENRLQDSDHFMWLLKCWRIWEGADGAAKWAKSFVKDPQSALLIATAATSTGSISGHRGTRTYNILLLKWLEQFVDIEETWKHLTNLEKNSLTDRQKHILQLYQRGLELKKQGKPYDQVQDEGDPFLGD